MRIILKTSCILICIFFISSGSVWSEIPFHESTEWQIKPSLKFDILCFLNTLTGDPYYLNYYQSEYNKFESKLTASARNALQELKRKVKDESKTIISAFLCLYFSAMNDQTLDDLLNTLQDSSHMKSNLKLTPYFSQEGWQLYQSIREDLKSILIFLKDIDFISYWKENILPEVEKRIKQIEKDLPRYNIISEVEKCLGFKLPSNRITVYMLYFSQPHGIRITGTRYLTDLAWPFEIVLRNAVHEMMHPPYDLKNDQEFKDTIFILKKDEFLMDKVLNHNPAYGYNSFEGFIEEDCVQALDQIICEKLDIAQNPQKRWKESDEGMHVFAVAVYKTMKEEKFCRNGEKFRDFLVRMIKKGRLSPGKIETIYNSFYAADPEEEHMQWNSVRPSEDSITLFYIH
jgi:hypothetical protein